MEQIFVTDHVALAEVSAHLREEAWATLDTEFMREQTYYAKLCLVQVATPQLIAVIDPLAVPMEPLLEALYQPSLLKVLHSARQDLELFYDLRATLPAPVFDTQIAAAFLGFDDQVGYGNLVEGTVGVRLEKSETRTNWALRPLHERQLRYAEDDVRYLRDAYLYLREALAERGRLTWAEQECARLVDHAVYANSLQTIHRRLKQGHLFSPEIQHVLRVLMIWRERAAQKHDLPRSWVLQDSDLVALGRDRPSSAAQVEALVPAARKWAAELADTIERAKAAAPTEGEALWEPPPQFTPAETKLLKQLARLVRERGQELQISASLLATRKELERLLLGAKDLPVLQGWREELVGRELLGLAQGA